MLDFLINHSIHLVGLTVVAIFGYDQYRKYIQKNNMTGREFLSMLRKRLNEVGNEVAAKFFTSVVVAFIISFISFRELFVTDVFHTVFLTMLLVRPVFKQVQNIFK